MRSTPCSLRNSRHAASAQAQRRVAVCGAWQSAGCGRGALAGPPHAALEADRGGMSSEPMNRKIDALIRDAGFAIMDIQAGYMRGPRPFTFMYEGRAKRG